MTSPNHTAAGFTMGWVTGHLLHFFTPWLWAFSIFCAIVAAFPDIASLLLYKFSQKSGWKWRKWGDWEFYQLCHHPYDPKTGRGKIDRWMKWFPPWGYHTWIIDPIVHLDQPKFIFPQFLFEWHEIYVINWTIFGKKVVLTRWYLYYIYLEAYLWLVYAIFILLYI